MNAWVTAANNNGNFSEVNDEAVESAVSQYLEAHAPRCNRGELQQAVEDVMTGPPVQDLSELMSRLNAATTRLRKGK